jgi:hypothetical protein
MSTPSGVYSPGLNHAGSYQVSGVPYVYGGLDASLGPISVAFPLVTSWITVHNGGTVAVKLGFSEVGVAAGNYITIPAGETTECLYLKTKEIWLYEGDGNVDVLAGLTNIPSGRMYELTGDGIDQ